VARILIVEDEPDIVLTLQEDLRRQGYETAAASDGESGLRMGKQEGFDLILLDVMLPKIDGFDVCRELRRSGVKTPVIMLTARTQEAEKVLGLDSGADDYVTKPFGAHELRARIRAMLRRTFDAVPGVCRFGDCEVDFERAEMRRAGKPVAVTAQELKLLAAFIRYRGHVLTREQLISAGWGPDIAITDRAVDQHVFNLRHKIEADPANPRILISVRGLGYRFDG